MTQLTEKEFNGTETEEIVEVAERCESYDLGECLINEGQCPENKSICCCACENISKCPDVCPDLNVRNGAGRRLIIKKT